MNLLLIKHILSGDILNQLKGLLWDAATLIISIYIYRVSTSRIHNIFYHNYYLQLRSILN